jgi:hypothetical protein
MKKIVNGKMVDVYNVELFERAAESLAINRLVASNIADRINVGSETINNCIKVYEACHKAMPYPLYAIESNAKYAAIAAYIKKVVGERVEMWVDNALFIWMNREKGSALKIMASTWSIVNINEDKEDNTRLDDYFAEPGYAEYCWVLMQIENKQSTASYYEEFMQDFVEACNHEPLIMQWELGNILNFGPVPDALTLTTNKVLDLETKSEYSLDIFVAGTRDVGSTEYVMSFNLGSKKGMDVRQKQVKVYDYDTYEKPASANKSYIKAEPDKAGDKLQKSKLPGILNIFRTLTSIRIGSEADKFEEFTGFLSDGDLVYTVKNRIFVCKAYKFVETKEIATGMKLISFDRGLIYMARDELIGNGVYKEKIYSYCIRDGSVRLCKIHFLEGAKI